MQRELVERAKAGDHDAFTVLARRAYPRLRGTANLILRDPERAQDAVQDALTLAWLNVRAVREADAWDSWLYRTTVRACYRLARSERRRQLVELAMPASAETESIDHSAILAQRDLLGRGLGRLPIDQRAVMVLHFYLDLPLGDVAEVLDIPIGTAKSRLHRGLEALRVSMAGEGVPALVPERSA
jgi:RNA polymerase sigma-70 factor (ECF subfamily)